MSLVARIGSTWKSGIDRDTESRCIFVLVKKRIEIEVLKYVELGIRIRFNGSTVKCLELGVLKNGIEYWIVLQNPRLGGWVMRREIWQDERLRLRNRMYWS
jgi:hypothetical protein